MAALNLGKIFSVDEDKEVVGRDEPFESGSDSEDDDEDALEREAAFNKSKRHSSAATPSSTTTLTASNRSIRRYDEYGDFISRSERAHAEKAAEKTGKLSKKESKRGGAAERAAVHFQDENLEQIKEIPKMSDAEKSSCFMDVTNWQSIDTDIDITLKRWKNHQEGTIPFDEDNNTIRGIEEMVFESDKSRPLYQHRKTILEEVVRQKTENEYPNWERLSAISETSSSRHRQQALDLAKQDETERIRVWQAVPKQIKATATSVGGKVQKKKKSIIGKLFSKMK